MSQLFDTAPDRDEDSKKRGSKRRSRPATPAVAEPEVVVPAGLSEGQYILKEIATIDDAVCSSCHGKLWDILDAHRGEWHVQCVFCGMLLWRPAVPGYLPEVKPEFRFRDGRLAGMTTAQAAAVPRGVDTMRIYAETHEDSETRDECRKWLDSNQPAA